MKVFGAPEKKYDLSRVKSCLDVLAKVVDDPASYSPQEINEAYDYVLGAIPLMAKEELKSLSGGLLGLLRRQDDSFEKLDETEKRPKLFVINGGKKE